MLSRKFVSYGVIALAGLAAPFGLQVDGGRVRLAEACASSFDCEPHLNSLCMKDDGTVLVNYGCTTGCGA